MAKKRVRATTTEDMAAEHRGAHDANSTGRDAIQAAARAQIATQHGGAQILTHDESLLRLGGIAVPALAVRYLFYQDALPLGRTLTLSGLFRSNKSSLAFEMACWILRHWGLAWYNSVEQKDAPEMRSAACDYDPALLRWFEPVECRTQEQWQGAAAAQFESIFKASEKRKDWRTYGVSIVDSVAAAKPKKEVEKFLSENGGAGMRGYATVALLNSDWLMHMAGRVSSGPFLLLLIQHSSEVPVDGIPGATQRKQKGGGEIGFVKSTALELSRIQDFKETDSGGGAKIKIACTKNSFGPTNRSITVPVKWWWEPSPEPDPVTGIHLRRQRYVWDWHEATIDLLLSFETMDGRKQTWKQLKEVCDIHKVTGRRVWSRALGIPESNPVKFNVAGEILEYEHPELLPALYDILHIARRPILVPGADLMDVWKGKVPVLPVPGPTPYPRRQIMDASDD